MLDENAKHGKCHKLRTHVVSDISLVGLKNHFAEVDNFRCAWLSGLVKGLTPVFELHEPPHRKPLKQQLLYFSSMNYPQLLPQEVGIRNFEAEGTVNICGKPANSNVVAPPRDTLVNEENNRKSISSSTDNTANA